MSQPRLFFFPFQFLLGLALAHTVLIEPEVVQQQDQVLTVDMGEFGNDTHAKRLFVL